MLFVVLARPSYPLLSWGRPRNLATCLGFCHESQTVSCVGFWGHINKCSIVWVEVLHLSLIEVSYTGHVYAVDLTNAVAAIAKNQYLKIPNHPYTYHQPRPSGFSINPTISHPQHYIFNLPKLICVKHTSLWWLSFGTPVKLSKVIMISSHSIAGQDLFATQKCLHLFTSSWRLRFNHSF